MYVTIHCTPRPFALGYKKTDCELNSSEKYVIKKYDIVFFSTVKIHFSLSISSKVSGGYCSFFSDSYAYLNWEFCWIFHF